MICSICQAPVPGKVPMRFSRGRVQLTLYTLPSTIHWGFSVNNPWSFFNICIISNTIPTPRAVLQWRQRWPEAGTSECGIQGAPPTGWSQHTAFTLHGSCKHELQTVPGETEAFCRAAVLLRALQRATDPEFRWDEAGAVLRVGIFSSAVLWFRCDGASPCPR